MTPIAAYYLFTAAEHERAAELAHWRARRPSLLDRIRGLVASVRSQTPLAGGA